MAAVVAATFMNVNQRLNAEATEAPATAQGSKARAEQHEREMKMQAKNEAILGNLHNVRTARAKIRNNKVFDTGTEEGKQAAAAWRIQLFARAFKHRKTKCHRENLGARLIFEEDLKIGLWRLFTQVRQISGHTGGVHSLFFRSAIFHEKEVLINDKLSFPATLCSILCHSCDTIKRDASTCFVLLITSISGEPLSQKIMVIRNPAYQVA
jgi:hypothetical protein